MGSEFQGIHVGPRIVYATLLVFQLPRLRLVGHGEEEGKRRGYKRRGEGGTIVNRVDAASWERGVKYAGEAGKYIRNRYSRS